MPALKAKDEIEALTRELLAEKVVALTEKQRALFVSIHENAPWKSWEKMPAARLEGAIDLCNRTLYQNEEGAT